jgi:crotonobetaine/carnitine-CoA ligase
MSAAAILARRPLSEYNPEHCINKMFLAPLNQDLKDTFNQRFGIKTLIECYGMSEIPGVLSNPFLGPHKIGSMGMISAHPSSQIEKPQVIILDDNGAEVKLGDIGEIAVKTPTIMQGYYKDPEQTQKSFSNGWFLTGDLGFKDSDDFFFFFTRKKDIIRRKGENLSGAEIDNAISTHPDVSECAAIGVPSDLGDEEVLVAVVARSGSNPTPQDIMAHAKAHLSALKLPRYIVMVDSLPHTGSMKIAKFKLKPATALLQQATDFS